MKMAEKKENIADNEKVKEIQAKVRDVIDLDFMEKVLSDNKIDFEFEKVKYRVSRPTFEQKQKTNQSRIAKYLELLKHPDFVLEADLKKLYKSKGIDIDELDKKIAALDKRRGDYQFKLGKAIKEKKPDNELKAFKEEIETLFQEQQEVSFRKTTLLEYSIESQVIVFVYANLTYLISEKLDGDKWVKVWETYEDFSRDNGNRVNKITYYASLIINDELSFFK